MVNAVAIGVEHCFVFEVSFLRGEVEFFEYPGGDWDMVYLCCYDFEGGGLEDYVGVSFEEFGGDWFCGFEEFFEACFGAPAVDCSSDEFGAGVIEHSDIIVYVALVVE